MNQVTDAYKQLRLRNIDSTAMVDRKSIRLINQSFRLYDESHLYPINSEYNASERAIRWYQRVYFKANGPCTNMEYIEGLNSIIGQYVNKV